LRIPGSTLRSGRSCRPCFGAKTLARTLRDIVSDAADAGSARGFDEPDAQVRRVSVAPDRSRCSSSAELRGDMSAFEAAAHQPALGSTGRRCSARW
jgi:hypothetical protein